MSDYSDRIKQEWKIFIFPLSILVIGFLLSIALVGTANNKYLSPIATFLGGGDRVFFFSYVTSSMLVSKRLCSLLNIPALLAIAIGVAFCCIVDIIYVCVWPSYSWINEMNVLASNLLYGFISWLLATVKK